MKIIITIVLALSTICIPFTFYSVCTAIHCLYAAYQINNNTPDELDGLMYFELPETLQPYCVQISKMASKLTTKSVTFGFNYRNKTVIVKPKDPT